MNESSLSLLHWRVKVCDASLCEYPDGWRSTDAAVHVVISGLIPHEITNIVNIIIIVGLLGMYGVILDEILTYMSYRDY